MAVESRPLGPVRLCFVPGGRDRCSMAVESRLLLLGVRLRGALRRDRCSMAVESRPGNRVQAELDDVSSRSMLDGCGIETYPKPEACNLVSGVAIDARWLWNRDHGPVARTEVVGTVAIDARWLWNRDGTCSCAATSRRQSRSMLDGCGIETAVPPSSQVARSSSRSMLDGCGIETDLGGGDIRPLSRGRDRCSMAVESRLLWGGHLVLHGDESRSMLDGCGIETRSAWSPVARASLVAIDARWLWNRDMKVAMSSGPPMRRSRSMLDGCGIETWTLQFPFVFRPARRDRCSMAVESRRFPRGDAGRSQVRRDRCSMAVESRRMPAT